MALRMAPSRMLSTLREPREATPCMGNRAASTARLSRLLSLVEGIVAVQVGHMRHRGAGAKAPERTRKRPVVDRSPGA